MKQLLFNINLALRTVKSNMLRSAITIFIIALGITALVGILTATDILKSGVNNNFNDLGANTFQIINTLISKNKKSKPQRGEQTVFNEGAKISFIEATHFKTKYNFPHTLVGISVVGSAVSTVAFKSKKTNPNIKVMGIDMNYANITQTKFSVGRNFSQNEIDFGSQVCILGYGIAKNLFKKEKDAIGKLVTVGAYKYTVIGVAQEKGGSMMLSQDNIVFIPLQTARACYGNANSFALNIWIADLNNKSIAVEEAEGLFRVIRKLPLGTDNNFSVVQNNSMVEMVNDILSKVGLAALLIASITLLGSIIGLMNIMLVSVVERTREIGISKSLGAKNASIKQQFLTEAIVISLLGGFVGIIFSLLIGMSLSIAFKTPFVIPWFWITIGIAICSLVGIVSGLYPAIKASKLDPIEALRSS